MTREELKENCLKESATEIIYASGWGIHESATDLLECAYRMGWEGADKHPNYTDIENFSDGYHTFKELYEYRLLYHFQYLHKLYLTFCYSRLSELLY